MKNPEFSDAADDIRGFGSLAGPGVTEHYQAKEKLDPNGEGVNYFIFCDSCGAKNKLTVSFHELTYGMMRVVPPGWKQAHGGLHPNQGCHQCRHVLMVIITPDECARIIRAGISQKKVPDTLITGWQQQIHAATRR